MLVSNSAKEKLNPMTYLGVLLADLNEKGIRSIPDIEKHLKKTSTKGSSNKKQTFNYEQREDYTPSELSAVIDSLDDVEF